MYLGYMLPHCEAGPRHIHDCAFRYICDQEESEMETTEQKSIKFLIRQSQSALLFSSSLPLYPLWFLFQLNL